MTTETMAPRRRVTRADLGTLAKLAGVALAWCAAYTALPPVTQWLTYNVIGLARGSHLGESVAFFLYDVPKILLLLAGMIFLISIVRTFFAQRQALADKLDQISGLV